MKVAHPHITSNPQICGGSPIIEGTRFPVRSVVSYILHHGLSPEELVTRFPHLNLAQIHDALAYYYDNRDEIQQDLDANREQHVRQRP
ncbi:MAG: DUF433 domain-containing protein [Nitrospiraceae bacterium]|nr:MAG: DUF433 domain-containing protein [Nitrospiraceae bacterium]